MIVYVYMCYGMRFEILKLNSQYISFKQALGSILRNAQMKKRMKEHICNKLWNKKKKQ